MADALTISGLDCFYGETQVLHGLSLSLLAGEVHCLLGRNGEGKSTLLKVAAGLLEPDAGEVVRARNLAVALMPQVVPGEMPGTVLEIVRRAVY